jgi:hypothetical protein
VLVVEEEEKEKEKETEEEEEDVSVCSLQPPTQQYPISEHYTDSAY